MTHITGKFCLSVSGGNRNSQAVAYRSVGNDVSRTRWIGLYLLTQVLDECTERMDAFGWIGRPKRAD